MHFGKALEPTPFPLYLYGVEVWEDYNINPTVLIGGKVQYGDVWYRIESWNPETQVYWMVP